MDPDLRRIQLELEEVEEALVHGVELLAEECYQKGLDESYSMADQAYKEGYDSGYDDALKEMEEYARKCNV